MKIYFAPIQGITDKIYRHTFAKHFSGIDKFFTPFELADNTGKRKKFPLNRLLPIEENTVTVIPQLISSTPKDFLETSNLLFKEGFQEVNLNAGCPYPTVTKKHRGAGMLESPYKLDSFFKEIFTNCDSNFSIKIRSGIRYHSELIDLAKIFNNYNFTEIIIHPRTLEQKYSGHTNYEIFSEFNSISKNKAIYNGDILSKADSDYIKSSINCENQMIGRGLILNPFLAEEIKSHHELNEELRSERLKEFIYDLMDGYSNYLFGDSHFLSKIKEFWSYQSLSYINGKAFFKKLKKIQSKAKIYDLTNDFFKSNQSIIIRDAKTIQNQSLFSP